MLLQFRPFRAVCLLCIYIALTDYAIQFRPFRALRAGTVLNLLSYKQLSLMDKREYPNGGGSLTEYASKSSNSSGPLSIRICNADALSISIYNALI